MERISVHQFFMLGAGVLLGTTFLPISSVATGAAGRDGWMSVLPAFALAIPFALIVLSLMNRYPRKNLLQISEQLFGRWIGKGIGIVYIAITAYFGGLLLAQSGDIFGRSIMPITPRYVFYVGGIILVFYLVQSGIEVFARFAEVVFPLVTVALVLNVGLSIPRMERGEYLPVLENGLKPLLAAGFKIAPFSMEYILLLSGLLVFLPTAKQEMAKLKTGVWKTAILIGILNTLVVLIQILVFGPDETTRLIYGLLVLGKMVEVSRTVAGVESLFMMVWLGALVIKVTALFYMAKWGIESVFHKKGLMWNAGLAALFLGITIKFASGPALIQEITLVDDKLILPFTSVWILMLWGFSHWKKGAGR